MVKCNVTMDVDEAIRAAIEAVGYGGVLHRIAAVAKNNG